MNFAVISVSLIIEGCEAIWEDDLLIGRNDGAVLVEFSDSSVELYELKPQKFFSTNEFCDFKGKLLWCSKLQLEQHIAKFNKPLWLMAAERARST